MMRRRFDDWPSHVLFRMLSHSYWSLILINQFLAPNPNLCAETLLLFSLKKLLAFYRHVAD